ncbi:unnamed protein product [Leptidea sinapis]|uniref:Ig-like domain-containing protein n=1 Tax=Leptidea sinapis TaxID=189913 RepID=A0A5E4QF55_9NEOP|nr:unnamed protein product [Leptidea sinapis]
MHLYVDGNARKHRAVGDGGLRFEPAPYNKKLELNGVGKIHCKVAGGVAPANDADALPEGVSTANGTLLIAEAKRDHAGQYTCRATEGETTISAKITLDVVATPESVISNEDVDSNHSDPTNSSQLPSIPRRRKNPIELQEAGKTMKDTMTSLNKVLNKPQALEGGANETTARIMVWNNGTLQIRNVTEDDAYHYGCTAGRNYFPPQESGGVAGKAVLVSISVAGAYMLLVLALMKWSRVERSWWKRERRKYKMAVRIMDDFCRTRGIAVKKLRNKDEGETEPQILPILVKALTTKDECQLSEFRRQLDLFSRGDLKTFLIATRTVEENEEYTARVGQSHALPQSQNTIPPLGNLHRVVLAQQLAGALNKIAAKRLTHRNAVGTNHRQTDRIL